jgi:hypothetical protein
VPLLWSIELSHEANLNDSKGFDEFMNLVIDDAVEVQLAVKGGKEEKRRQLGIITSSHVND